VETVNKYHKIQTVFLRDPATKFKTLLMGRYALPTFEYLKNLQWEFTEKVDGTNIRVKFDGSHIVFAGKTDRAELYPGLVTALNSVFFPASTMFYDLFKPYPDNGVEVCLYGEGYGAKIQKGGGNYRKDQGFVLFDIKINGVWLQRKDVEGIGEALAIDVVPVIGWGTLSDMVRIVKTGFHSQWGKFWAEGIVARPVVELTDRLGRRIITKLKAKDFV
jgi:hypothetical protein